MKNYILKSIILTLFVSVFTSCSNNNEQDPFQPVTINFEGVTVNVGDTSFIADGFTFNAYRAETVTSDQTNQIPDPFTTAIGLYNSDNNGISSIELMLNNLDGVSTITVVFADFVGGTVGSTIEIYSNGVVIEEKNTLFGQNDTVSFDVSEIPIEKVRLSSFEGFAASIRLE